MIWTTDKPTKPGEYWYRDGSTAAIVCVDFDTSVRWFSGRRGVLSDLKGQWAGPIPEPEEQP